MGGGKIRAWLLGAVAIGSVGLLFALGRGSARGAVDGARAVAAVVPPVPAPLACASAPSSPQVLNVREAPFGAKGDGLTDDTAALQRAVDAVGTGGTVLIPDGTYLVNAAVQGSLGIRLKSAMTLRLSPGAVLKAIPNAAAHYAILAIHRADHVNVVGGTLLGERDAHSGRGGEWGMGLSMVDARHVVVEGVTARDCWGDGFYVSGRSADVTLCNVVADRNRRQGLSITSAEGMTVRNSTFKNTTGTEPEAGVDVEPNDGQIVRDVLITGCTLAGNAGGGFQCGFNARYTTPRILNVVFDRNVVTGNGLNPAGGGYRAAVKVDHCVGRVSITNNDISWNMGQGVILMEFSADTIVTGNTITHTAMFNGNNTWTGGGIYVSQSPRSVVRGNTVKANAGLGIWLVDKDPTVDISGNTVVGNGGPGIRHAVAAAEAVNKANTVSGNGKRP